MDWWLNSESASKFQDFGLLVLRCLFGLTLSFRHGWPTLADWWHGEISYPDPIGLGESLTMFLMGTAEAVFTLFIALGLFTRPAALCLVLGFATAFFVVHAADSFATKELPFLYLSGMTAIFLLGAGRFSLDRFFWRV
ncbi:DoxX family protein [Pararhodonellum marinum]|uniref:DoxX family protein n=1 Tax=Pararhodonellum marinum TaxID=2755358 RepID=UPI00188FAEB2|nr:DoxX family protein [Pararhodonellum marinum]